MQQITKNQAKWFSGQHKFCLEGDKAKERIYILGSSLGVQVSIFLPIFLHD